MALVANTANVQILVDDSKRVVAKLLMHQDTLGDEADVLKINVATLSSRTLILTGNNAVVASAGFVIGEKLTGNSGVGYVYSFDAPTKKTVIVLESGTFAANDVVTGGTSGFSDRLASFATPTYLLDIDNIWWSVTGAGKAELAFDDNGTKKPVVHLSGSGTYDKNTFAAVKIPNIMTVPNGNLYVSTYGVPAKGGYSIIVSLRKQSGFASRPVY